MRRWLVTLLMMASLTGLVVVPIGAQVSTGGASDPQDHKSLTPYDFQSDYLDLSKVRVSPVSRNGYRHVYGEAGAVKNGAGVSVINRRTGERVTVDATADGSFLASIKAVEEDRLLVLSRNSYPDAYSASALEAWVVDADTSQPLEKAIVVARWELVGGIHTDTVGYLMMMETTTDAQGRIFFPAWGPKPRPTGTFFWNGDPQLLVFKSGYKYEHLRNPDGPITKDPLRHSQWDGKTIKLKKFQGSLEEYAKYVGNLDDKLEFAFDPNGDCEWKQIPHMLVAMHRENKRFREQGLRASSDYPKSIEDRDSSYQVSLAKCGSIQEFLRSYLP